MRYALMICVSLMLSTSVIADEQEQMYQQLFGAKEKQVIESRSTSDDLDFARLLHASSQALEEQPALRLHILKKALEFGMKDSDGRDVVDAIITALQEEETDVLGEHREAIAEYYESLYRKAGIRDRRGELGQAYLNHLLQLGAYHEEQINPDAAMKTYQDASRVATVLGDREQARALKEQSKSLIEQSRAVRRIQALKDRVLKGEATEEQRQELMLHYLLEYDKPAATALFAKDSNDEVFKANMEKLMAKPETLTDQDKVKLAEWLEVLANNWESDNGKRNGYRRALSLASEVILKNEGQGLDGIKSKLIASRIQPLLEKLGEDAPQVNLPSSMKPGLLFVNSSSPEARGVIYKPMQGGWNNKLMPDQTWGGKGEIEIYGFIIVPVTGEYEFVASEFNHAMDLVKINDVEIPGVKRAEKSGNASGFEPVKIKLKKGTWSFYAKTRVIYSKFGLWWKAPGQDQLQPVPIEAMRYSNKMFKELKINPEKEPKGK